MAGDLEVNLLEEGEPQGPKGGSGTVWGSIVNLSATTMGAGILSLPVAVQLCGGVMHAVAVLLGFALISDYSLVLIVKSARKSGKQTLEEIGRFYYGEKGATLVKTALLLLLVGTQICLLIIVGDALPPAFQYFVTGAVHKPLCPEFDCATPAWWAGTVRCDAVDLALTCTPPPLWASRAVLTAVLLLLVYPMTLFKNLSALRFTSTAAVASIIFVMVAVIVDFSNVGPADDASVIGLKPTLFMALSIAGMAYNNQFNMMEIEKEMKADSRDKVYCVIHTAIIGLVFPLYALFSAVGYLRFGEGVSAHDNILKGFPVTDRLMLSASLAIGILNTLRFPLYTLPCREVWNEMMGWKVRARDVIVKDLTAAQVALEMALLLLFDFVCAMLMQKLALGFQILGSSAAVTVSFIIPGMFYYKAEGLDSPTATWCQRAGPLGMIFVGIMIFVVTMIGIGMEIWGASHAPSAMDNPGLP